MSTGDQVDVVDVIEFGSDFGSKEPSSTSWRHSPCLNLLWIGPHKITERTFVRDFHSSVDESHLVDCLDLG